MNIEVCHFEAGSALFDFIAGRLGAPECWPNENQAPRVLNGVHNEVRCSIERWENEGGKHRAAHRNGERPGKRFPANAMTNQGRNA